VLEAADHIVAPGVPEGATEAGILKIGQHLHSLERTITGLVPTRIVTTSKKHRQTIADWKRANGLGALVYHDPPRGLVGLPQRVVYGIIASPMIEDLLWATVEAYDRGKFEKVEEVVQVRHRLRRGPRR
jgi:cellulose biosynthesis protein BcsQ